jgi:hypothetical protein
VAWQIGSRLVWWFGNDPSGVQAVCAILSTIITGVLCYLTYRYMRLTRELANTAMEQVRASVRPIVKVRLSFGGGASPAGQEIFKDQIVVDVTNSGAPLLISRVWLEWDHYGDSEMVRHEVPGFRDRVFSPQEGRKETMHAWHENSFPTPEHFPSWSDFVTAEIHCSDLGGLCPTVYVYRNADGVRIVQA